VMACDGMAISQERAEGTGPGVFSRVGRKDEHLGSPDRARGSRARAWLGRKQVGRLVRAQERLAQLSQGARLDLAHALLAEAELLAELIQRDAVAVDQLTPADHHALARSQCSHGLRQPLRAKPRVMRLGRNSFRIGTDIGQEVLPFVMTVLAD